MIMADTSLDETAFRSARQRYQSDAWRHEFEARRHEQVGNTELAEALHKAAVICAKAAAAELVNPKEQP